MRNLILIVVIMFMGCETNNLVETGSNNYTFLQSDHQNTHSTDEHKDTSATNFLFVGSSYTFYNDMPGIFEKMAVESGYNVDVDYFVEPGTPLRIIAGLIDFKKKINEKNWDYIILQSNDITAIPYLYQVEIDAVNKIKGLIDDAGINPKVIYQMAWGFRDGIKTTLGNGDKVDYTFEEHTLKIYEGTIYVAGQVELPITPVGYCWFKVRESYQDIDLFHPDKIHPSVIGSYAIALTHYSMIYRESTENLTYNHNLDTNITSSLKQITSKTVLENLAIWDVDNVTGISDPFGN